MFYRAALDVESGAAFFSYISTGIINWLLKRCLNESLDLFIAVNIAITYL